MSDTALSSAAIKLLFETGDIPTQQNFADAWTSYPNLIDNNQLDGMALTITAHAGGGQGSATAITKRFNVVTTCATNLDSIVLPAALAGRTCIVGNNTLHKLAIFPASGETITNYSVNVALPATSLSITVFTCMEDGAWTVTQYFFQSIVSGVYRAIMNQTGTAVPVATILENTLGFTPTWHRDAAGAYYVSDTGQYVDGKTFPLCGIDQSSSGIICVTDAKNDAPDIVYFKCYNTLFTGVDVNRFYVELRIYP